MIRIKSKPPQKKTFYSFGLHVTLHSLPTKQLSLHYYDFLHFTPYKVYTHTHKPLLRILSSFYFELVAYLNFFFFLGIKQNINSCKKLII